MLRNCAQSGYYDGFRMRSKPASGPAVHNPRNMTNQSRSTPTPFISTEFVAKAFMAHRLPTLRRSGILVALLCAWWFIGSVNPTHAQFRESKISTSDGDANDRFGESIAIDGSTVVVGAFRDDDAGFDAGAAYVYALENDEWVLKQKIVPNHVGLGLSRIDRGLFGNSIDIRDDVIVVGAMDSRENGLRIGAAYVYERVAQNNWKEQARLTPDDLNLEAGYGSSVATNASYVLIGAHSDNHSDLTNPGAVYAYRRNTTDGQWVLAQKIVASDPQDEARFGSYVAIDGNRAVIGARDMNHEAENAGAAYVFELVGDSWQQMARLTASDAATDDKFGSSVAIRDDRIIVGAREVDGVAEEAGAAYIYELVNSQWTETARLTADDGESLDRFGNSVAIEGDYAVVSTRIDDDFTGATYIFQRFSGVWTQLAKLIPRRGEPGDLFGQAVALRDFRLVVSATGDDDEGIDAGAAYIYNIHNADRGVLVSLFNSTNGREWDRGNNWLSEEDVGTWYGVTTNDQGQIVALELEDNNLTGELPAALGSLPALERLDLNTNNLTGAVPDELGALTALQLLDLSDNLLDQEIPESIANLSNLNELFLDGNQLIGGIPESLAGLTPLQKLYLQNNLLEDLPDLSQSNALSQLSELRVQNNRLTFEDLEPNINLPGFQYAPQARLGEPRSETLSQNNPLILQIQVGGENNSYQWKKNGIEIPGANSDTYIIPAVTSGDAGVYAMEATNTLVGDLTLVSEPIVVSVLAVVTFEAVLRSIHVIDPVLSTASGSISARLFGKKLTVSGTFQDLEAEFSQAALHIGAPNVETSPAFELTPTFNGDEGAFLDGENSFELTNEQIIALQNGLFYVEIETLRGSFVEPSAPELRGQLYVNPNAQPAAPVMLLPENGLTVDLSEPGELEIAWEASTDPQGHPVHYFWFLSRNRAFIDNAALIDRIIRQEDNMPITWSYEDLDTFLAAQGVASGESITFYHTTAASDGSLLGANGIRSLTLQRVSNNRAPFLSQPIEDFIHIVDDGEYRLDLTTIFLDPDGDDLEFSAGSSDENIALAAIDADSLVITPADVGQVEISVSASDASGENAEDQFELTLNRIPRIVNTIEPFRFVVGDDPSVVDLTPVFFDEDEISVSAASDNEAVAGVEVVDMQLTITPLATGGATITVTAQDDKGSTASLTIDVVVQPDVITPPQSVQENISISFGNPDLETSYRLVALPGVVDLSIGEAVSGVQGVDWIAYRDTGGEGDREDYFARYDGSAAFNFRPGRGFWLLSKSTWERTESRSTVTLTGDGVYPIPLQAGWNIISNPFDIDIPWQAVTQTNEISQALHRWNGRFEQTTTFSSAKTGQAFYFFNSEELDRLILPYLPATPGEAPPETLPALVLTASTGGKTLSTLRLGNHEEALSGADRFDQVAPPRAFEAVSIRAIQLSEPEKSRKRLLSEQYEPAHLPGYRYEISLAGPTDEPLTLALEESGTIFAGQKIVLIDQTLAKRYDLNKNPSETLWLTAPEQTFVVLVGDDAYIDQEAAGILPRTVSLLPGYPNPFARRMTIEFTLPEPKSVQLVVYDALGRQVRTLKKGALAAGHYSVVWDGRNDAGSPLSSGLYFYQLLLPDSRLVRSAVLRH